MKSKPIIRIHNRPSLISICQKWFLHLILALFALNQARALDVYFSDSTAAQAHPYNWNPADSSSPVPFWYGDFDTALHHICSLNYGQEYVNFHLAGLSAGHVYEMYPIILRGENTVETAKTPYLKILGGGPTTTTIKLKSNSPPPDGAVNFLYAFRNYYLMKNFEIRDLTIDCNWSAQGNRTTQTTAFFKLGGILIRTEIGLYYNVSVKNYGSNGAGNSVPGTDGTEVFPLKMEVPYTGGLFITPLQILFCAVTDGHFVNQGYGTAISVNTRLNQAGSGGTDRPSTAVAGLVQDCLVDGGSDFSGAKIAYGAGNHGGYVDNVQFIGNTARNCDLGFNFDTGDGIDFTMDGNNFIDVLAGISIGAPGFGVDGIGHWRYFTIQNNWFRLRGVAQNSACGEWYDCYGINLASGTKNFTIRANRFTAVAASSFGPKPSNWVNSYYYAIRRMDDTWYHKPCDYITPWYYMDNDPIILDPSAPNLKSGVPNGWGNFTSVAENILVLVN